MAPDAGFEPATKRLTAAYSTAELIRIAKRLEFKLLAVLILANRPFSKA